MENNNKIKEKKYNKIICKCGSFSLINNEKDIHTSTCALCSKKQTSAQESNSDTQSSKFWLAFEKASEILNNLEEKKSEYNIENEKKSE